MLETLVFTIPGKGTITVEEAWNEWFLLEGRERTFLNRHWFYDKLHDDYEGICRLASTLEYQCDFEEGRQRIKEYEAEYEKCIGNGNFDVCVMFLEVFFQLATKTENLHWW